MALSSRVWTRGLIAASCGLDFIVTRTLVQQPQCQADVHRRSDFQRSEVSSPPIFCILGKSCASRPTYEIRVTCHAVASAQVDSRSIVQVLVLKENGDCRFGSGGPGRTSERFVLAPTCSSDDLI